MNNRTAGRKKDADCRYSAWVRGRAGMSWLARHCLGATLALVVLFALPTGALAAPQKSSYVVEQGDTLAEIAARMGVSIWALAEANGIRDIDLIHIGQVITAPGASTPATGKSHRSHAEHGWIDISLSAQWLTAYEGDTPVFGVPVSTGVEGHYTPVGEFAVEYMLDSQTMWGEDYYLPDVPYVMYFADYLAIHGTYWHSNFGHPMSHGCINLSIPDAEWLYNWANIGTPVVIHY